ncbi:MULTISPECIES: two-component regulator propeller domain-containing protein [unclassified Carboxylicivirga]|uniref:ligand-binding sensor domain-containing protein n=1 Tax=Carboxylicivirga TaxID=1628153 RepID=UPI003D33A484
MRYYQLLLILTVLRCVPLTAQHSPMRFQSLTIDDGLSLSSVYCIARDSKGFMWLGTEDGLNRFDGYHFTIYRTEVKNPNSICYKWIEHIAEDQQGNLWFGSRSGLSCFDPASEVFMNFRTGQEHSLCNDTVTCLQGFDDVLYVGTKGGLNRIELADWHTHHYPEMGVVHRLCKANEVLYVAASSGLFEFGTAGNPLRLSEISLVDVCVRSDTLYCASAQSVFLYDRHNGSKQQLILPDNLRNIEGVELDNRGHLWINTQAGLWLYKISTGQAQKIVSTNNVSNSLAVNTRKALWIAEDNSVWYATHGDGLFVINEQLRVSKSIHNPTDKESVNQNAFNCIFADPHSGNIWLGTFGAGINVYQPSANKFDMIKHNPLDDNSLPSNFIWSVWEATDSCLWIGTNDGGLCCYCPHEDRFVTYIHDGSAQSISHNSVREVYQDKEGTIWVGTDGGGLNRFNAANHSFSIYRNRPGDDSSLSDNSVRVVFEDSKRRLWVGTRKGLNLFNRDTGTFRRYMHQEGNVQSLSNDFIYASIIEDDNGHLWIGTYGGGLNRFDPDKGIFQHYTSNMPDGKRLSNDIVFSLYKDALGLIWIGTNEGLNVLNPKNGQIRMYGMADGLPNEVIYSILPDEQGRLWLSTNYGISCVQPDRMAFRNYDVSDGLQSNEFNGGAFHKGTSGRLYFGGVYGLNILYPGTVQPNTQASAPVFTRLEVLGQAVQTRPTGLPGNAVMMVDSQYIMPQYIAYARHIVLDYSQRFFAIEYSGLNHLFAGKTEYAFQLLPQDKEWHKAGARNYVSFADVKPGSYTFRVISTNSDGYWCKTPTELGITIQPPFWKTTWFMMLELVVLILVAVFTYRVLIKIKTNKVLLHQNEAITKANEQLKASEENLRQMNVTKDKFFSIISHDLKNPFTSLMSISSLLDESYDVADEEDKRLGVKRINNTAKQIYQLLENLLTWSRSQRGKISFQDKSFDLTALIIENANLYRDAAERKGVQIINEVKQRVMARGDRNTVNTVIRNLSGNAVKFTPKGGTVKYFVEDEDNHWKVSVCDSGVGISADDQQHLFSIDKKIKTEGTEGEKGTGLGLIICKEFIEKNGGRIGVESEAGRGSIFWFTLRKCT